MTAFRTRGRYAMSCQCRFGQLPSEEFELCFPENFAAFGVPAFLGFWDTPVRWEARPDGLDGSARDGVGEVRVQFAGKPCGLVVRWRMTLRHRHPRPLDQVLAFNCLDTTRAPLFRDPGLDRTTVRDATGRWVALRDVPKTAGPRSVQFYAAAGGIDIPAYPWVREFGHASPTRLSGDRVRVGSADGKWVLENVAQGPVAFFFNNWEPGRGCVHAAPLFGSVEPDTDAVAEGYFRLVPASAVDHGDGTFT